MLLGNSAAGGAFAGKACSAPDSRLSTFFDVAYKLTLAPETVTAGDFSRLKFHGFDESAVIMGILIVVGFNIINRVADALSFDTPPEVGFTRSAHFLRRFGYRLLSGPILLKRTSWIKLSSATRWHRPGIDILLLARSMETWLSFLSSRGEGVCRKSPDVAEKVVRGIMGSSALLTREDLSYLVSRGCNKAEILDLILSAAAAAGLLRLRIALTALQQSERSSRESGFGSYLTTPIPSTT